MPMTPIYAPTDKRSLIYPMTMIAQAEGVMEGTFPHHVMLIHIQTL
jgi:hypothetical protein